MAEEGRPEPRRAWEETKPPPGKSRQRREWQQQQCAHHPDSPWPCSTACFKGHNWKEREALECIDSFLKGNDQDEAQKMNFLNSILNLVIDIVAWSPEKNMDRKALLVEKITEMLQHESVDSLTDMVRQQAMLIIMEMRVKPPLQDLERSSLLTACFSSVFSLPPAETMQGEEAALYTKTLRAMDQMLKALACENQEPRLLVVEKILEALLPWTASKEVHGRLRAVERITCLMKFMACQPECKEAEEFRVLGQLVACVTLCHPEQEICRSSMEAFYHLYSFMLQLKSMTLANSEEHRQLLKDKQILYGSWDTLFTNTSDITWMFGKYFNGSERMDFLCTAIDSMKDTSVHDSVVARHMLHEILMVPGPRLERVSEAVMSIYKNLESISEPLSRKELFMTLLMLGNQYSEEVVRTLLGCSLSCDSVAAEMWRMLASHCQSIEKVLKELLNTLREQPLHHHHVSQREAPLAATRALYEIFKEQNCRQQVKELFPQLSIALLFQITYIVELSMHNQEDTPAPLSPVRCAVDAMQALLQCAGYRDQTTFIHKQGGWGMLVNADMHHKGVLVLARAMVSVSFQERCWIFQELMAILNCRDDRRYIPAMAFFIQLLQCPDLGNKQEDAILDQLSGQLRDPNTVVRWLALKGLLNLSLCPEKVGKLQRLLPEVLEQLQEVDRDIIAEAITVLKNILASMDRQSASRAAVQVAEKLLPFIDDVSSRLRVLSITLFKHLLELVRGLDRWRMKAHVLQSLVPLLLLVHDERPNVSQVCWDTLSSAAEFLKWHQLGGFIQRKDTWQSCDCLLTRYKGRANNFLCQTMAFLENPQTPLRQAAIRFIGLAARQLDQRSQDKLDAICNDLKGLQQDSNSSVQSLASQTIFILEAFKNHPPAHSSLWTCFHRIRTMCTKESPVIEAAQLP
ncbi:maestro heat-like repeat-containing protein family member 7 isoform X2 [Chrysemys picta bellii]|uniref:maestro heat-like repeat-containing protein family member 7 isoform X2 n=1 Tax=Chrysemys picta bellii TaxID=8478 RepID=UPI0032B2ED01